MTVLPVFLAAVVVLAVCLVLVFHRQYEDGLVGRIALGIIGYVAFSRAAAIVEDPDVYVSNLGALLWLALAVFLSRHLYRFLSWRRRGENEWRQTDPAVAAGKHRQA